MNRTPVLFLNVLVIATCGLVYELLAATQASYYLGDSVTVFSLVIGVYLSAMGVGSWLSRFIDRAVARAFLEVELGVALVGGLSVPVLLLGFGRVHSFHLLLYGLVAGLGVLVGLELPLLMRIARDHLDFKELVSRVLAFDYVGALAASVLFPLLFVPQLGLVRTGLFFGMLNALVGLWGTWLLRPLLDRPPRGLRLRAVAVLLLLASAFAAAETLQRWGEESLFPDEVAYARTTPYQRIVVTRNRVGFQLFLNGHLQCSSLDEYRYHEALVHPALVAAGRPRRVLVLGGGDGLALREVLRHPSVEAVTLVDIDPDMTRLSGRFPPLAALNQHAFDDPRVTVVNRDALIWLEESGPPFDTAIVDFPDPNSYAVGKLYTTRFYRLLRRRLAARAVVGVQSTTPLVARTSYWCIVRTLEASGFTVHPYHAAVPSFGVWGFALASPAPFEPPTTIPTELQPGLRFLNDEALAGMFVLPADLGPVPVEVNRLDNQRLVRYYEAEWKRWE